MRPALMTRKNPRKPGFGPLLLGLLLLTAEISVAQENAQAEYSRRITNGTQLYREARMSEAAAEFRRAQETAVNAGDWAQALYWVILSELALADYGSALRDMDELERLTPNSAYARDMVYHRARVYFNQGYFEDAMVLFKRYSDGISSDDIEKAHQKASAFFWTGECLYFMGQFEEAEKFYAWVITKYPDSPKIEVSSYRIDLIKQKKIEAELLALLRWSHEESLRTSEDYQRKIKTYENTLNSYQRRIAELSPERSGQPLPPVVPEGPQNGQTGTEAGVQEDLPEDEVNGGVQIAPEELIERARQLGSKIQRLIKEYENAGGAM